MYREVDITVGLKTLRGNV